jgi:hypothetical protein
MTIAKIVSIWTPIRRTTRQKSALPAPDPGKVDMMALGASTAMAGARHDLGLSVCAYAGAYGLILAGH